MTKIQQFRIWLRKIIEGKAGVWKVLFFLSLPQLVAAIITGHSLSQVWKDIRGQGIEEHNNLNHIIRVALVWAAAYLWLVFFWGVVIFLFKKAIV